MANQNDRGTAPATERVSAPATGPQWILPHQKQVGTFAQGGGYPVSHRYPEVRGGVCEFCGVLDPNQPSQMQYKLCPHYRGMELVCDYCGSKRDPEETTIRSTLNIHDHPENPNLLVVRCNQLSCIQRHEARFKVSA